MKWNNFSG